MRDVARTAKKTHGSHGILLGNDPPMWSSGGEVSIPEAAATSTALAFRLVTFYLPPLWGGFAMRWMKQQSHL